MDRVRNNNDIPIKNSIGGVGGRVIAGTDLRRHAGAWRRGGSGTAATAGAAAWLASSTVRRFRLSDRGERRRFDRHEPCGWEPGRCGWVGCGWVVGWTPVDGDWSFWCLHERACAACGKCTRSSPAANARTTTSAARRRDQVPAPAWLGFTGPRCSACAPGIGGHRCPIVIMAGACGLPPARRSGCRQLRTAATTSRRRRSLTSTRISWRRPRSSMSLDDDARDRAASASRGGGRRSGRPARLQNSSVVVDLRF